MLLVLLACGQGTADPGPSNTAPKAMILEPLDGETVLATFDAEGVVQDAEDEAESLFARWYMNNIEVCEGSEPDAQGLLVCPVQATPGTWELRLAVLDTDGLGSSYSITLLVE